MQLYTDRSAPQQARLFTQLWALKHRVPAGVMDDLLLAVTELVTDAVCYGQPPIDIELAQCDGTIRGIIRDGSADRLAFHGEDVDGKDYARLIVEACTSRWGTDLLRDMKVVWFEIDCSERKYATDRWGAHATYN